MYDVCRVVDRHHNFQHVRLSSWRLPNRATFWRCHVVGEVEEDQLQGVAELRWDLALDHTVEDANGKVEVPEFGDRICYP